MVSREILNSHPISTLKKEISKVNIKKYSKLTKPQLVELMMKYKERFGHIKMAEKPARAPRAAKPKKEDKPGPVQGPRNLIKGFGIKRLPKKEEPKKEAPKKKATAKPKKSKDDSGKQLKRVAGVSKAKANKLDAGELFGLLPPELTSLVAKKVKETLPKASMYSGAVVREGLEGLRKLKKFLGKEKFKGLADLSKWGRDYGDGTFYIEINPRDNWSRDTGRLPLIPYNVIDGSSATPTEMYYSKDIDCVVDDTSIIPLRTMKSGLKVFAEGGSGDIKILVDITDGSGSTDKYGSPVLPMIKDINPKYTLIETAVRKDLIRDAGLDKDKRYFIITDYGASFIKNPELDREKRSEWGPYSWGLLESVEFFGKEREVEVGNNNSNCNY